MFPLLHPLLVHFPIALLCTAAIWDLIRREPKDQAFGWRLWCIGTAAAVVASIAGIYDHFPHRRGPSAELVMTHQLWGLGVCVAALSWAMWRGYQRHLMNPDPASSVLGRAVTAIIAGGVLFAASGGGKLVLEHGVGVTGT